VNLKKKSRIVKRGKRRGRKIEVGVREVKILWIVGVWFFIRFDQE
tara:strand:+ start:10408 stop:10542 length:135 start_codon:yes stop_codon:yes gene_type:complete